jgi:hypothetical protein
MSTPTPRTDAAVELTFAAGHNTVCPNFARTLERELAACKESLHLADGTANLALVHRDAAEAEVKQLKTDGAASAFVNMASRASRAETDRNNLRADLDAIKAILTDEKARADRAEAELKAEQDNSVLAEAELANIRALANRRNKQDHSHDTTHQLVASLDQSLDIVQAELVEERWLKGCAIKRSQELLSELASERARLDWLMAGGVCMMQAPGGFYISRLHAHVSRAAIDAAMKEDAK